MAMIERTRCWLVPMRPVTPFMMMPRRRVGMSMNLDVMTWRASMPTLQIARGNREELTTEHTETTEEESVPQRLRGTEGTETTARLRRPIMTFLCASLLPRFICLLCVLCALCVSSSPPSCEVGGDEGVVG